MKTNTTKKITTMQRKTILEPSTCMSALRIASPFIGSEAKATRKTRDSQIETRNIIIPIKYLKVFGYLK